MKYILVVFLRSILNLIYIPMKKIVRNKKKIVYLSRQSKEKSLDIKLLCKEIEKRHPDYEQVFRLRVIEEGYLKKIKYFFGILVDMYHIAGASVAICDTYSIPISCLKHKDSLVVIQIWHAMGAVKKFGLQSLGKAEGRDEKLSKAMQMHKNYDWVIAPSKKTGQFYEEAFGVKENKIAIYTLPRIDFVCDGENKKQELVKQNPKMKDKKIILYLPTFRRGEERIVRRLFDLFKADKETELIISLHPLSQVKHQEGFGVNGDFSTYDLIKIADQIITDYSACAFEAAVLLKPLWFYVPDYKEYGIHRGLNIDLKEEMKDYVFDDCYELYRAIKTCRYDFNDLKKFRSKYVANTEKCTKKLAEFICENLEDKKGVGSYE